MKAIYINGDDYGALQFENKFKGTKVSDVISNFQDYVLVEHGGNVEADEEDSYWEIEVIEVGEVSPEFLKFVRDNIQDYDDLKHSNFYLETQSI